MRNFLSSATGSSALFDAGSGLLAPARSLPAEAGAPAPAATVLPAGARRSVQAFTPPDIPQVVSLHKRIFPESALPCEDLAGYFRRMFFENPWYDPAIPSLVYRGEEEKILGFYGVVPRRMRWRGQPVRVALSTQFMVDPSIRHQLAAVALQSAFFAGPQDLSLTDGANDASRKVWEALGGFTAFPYSVHWTRILRPGRYLLSRGRERGLPALLHAALRPFCAAADCAAARLRFSPFRQAAQPAEEQLSSRMLLQFLSSFEGPGPLWPEYDEESLGWLLEEAARKECHGRLRTLLVRNNAGHVAGWCMYYLKPGGVSQVLQLAGARNAIPRVLHQLFYHAWRGGAAAVSGRLDPALVEALSRERCLFHFNGPWVLVHSRRPELREIILRGEAFLTRLEGEWWMRFQGG